MLWPLKDAPEPGNCSCCGSPKVFEMQVCLSFPLNPVPCGLLNLYTAQTFVMLSQSIHRQCRH